MVKIIEILATENKKHTSYGFQTIYLAKYY